MTHPLISALQSEPNESELWQLLSQMTFTPEQPLLDALVTLSGSARDAQASIEQQAGSWVTQIRQAKDQKSTIDELLQEYSLSSQEGVILMSLAEALLRIPDTPTANALISDKLSLADWKSHLNRSESFLVNTSTQCLTFAQKIAGLTGQSSGLRNQVQKFLKTTSLPVIRNAIQQAIKIMGDHFVKGQTIQEALKRSEKELAQGYRFSYDMLGEAAMCDQDAERFEQAYKEGIEALAPFALGEQAPTISIKLSALHPYFETRNEAQVRAQLGERLLRLCRLAKHHGLAVTIDAEEANRLELTLILFKQLLTHEELQNWGLLGIAVQAYGKRALPSLMMIRQWAQEQGVEIPVRLVKGAYWDSEVKWAQQEGLPDYPVFTSKAASDISYLACAQYLLSAPCRGKIYPQFATHNAHSAGAILALAGNNKRFEFQRLHGMGGPLYDALMADRPSHCRIYAPVGRHKQLLPYLVRRLLENSANTSFVHHLYNEQISPNQLLVSPYAQLDDNQRVKPINQVFMPLRQRARGLPAKYHFGLQDWLLERQPFLDKQWQAKPLVADQWLETSEPDTVCCPHHVDRIIGQVHWATEAHINQALKEAQSQFISWSQQSPDFRATILDNLAEQFEQHRAELITLCQLEAGKTLEDAVDEIREAIDFCYYYAAEARKMQPIAMPSVTGESNELEIVGKGPFVCISPWNFPLAIFIGQVAAALVTGNTVIAKPAPQTNLVAARAIELAQAAGLPKGVLSFLPIADPAHIELLTQSPIVHGVCFTGSTATAQRINQTLAQRPNAAIATLIAETGGQNAMLVDSTALPDQVVTDVVQSAFLSAGQRCSCLRALYLQEEIADEMIALIREHVQGLSLGDPLDPTTDIGPVIDQTAQARLQGHIDSQPETRRQALLAKPGHGHFVSPTLVEIDHIEAMNGEHFGPVLHVIRYKSKQVDEVMAEINQCGFGLTLGVHSRNQHWIEQIVAKAQVGNVYVNRNMVGAVVASQPFGGRGLSGTGPKAGGPFYLHRFVTEKTITINTTAFGGNQELLG